MMQAQIDTVDAPGPPGRAHVISSQVLPDAPRCPPELPDLITPSHPSAPAVPSLRGGGGGGGRARSTWWWRRPAATATPRAAASPPSSWRRTATTASAASAAAVPPSPLPPPLSPSLPPTPRYANLCRPNASLPVFRRQKRRPENPASCYWWTSVAGTGQGYCRLFAHVLHAAYLRTEAKILCAGETKRQPASALHMPACVTT